MNDTRPVNLDLTKFHFPVTAIISILHRISGVVLFLFVPFIIFLLHQTLASKASFLAMKQCLSWPEMRILLWVLLTAVFYHLLAGIRHILMDCGFAESVKAGRATAFIVLLLTVVLAVWAGVILW